MMNVIVCTVKLSSLIINGIMNNNVGIKWKKKKRVLFDTIIVEALINSKT